MKTLEWVATPHPDTPDIESESSDDHEKDAIFPAYKFMDEDLPTPVKNDMMKDMTYWEAESLANTLESFIPERKDKDTTQLLRDASDWLHYWSNERKNIYASY